MGQTSKYNLRYPESTDFVRNTATYIQNLAEDVENTLNEQLENIESILSEV